ncbi:hypothetical protein C8Q77DRAFT_1096212 [Trametes polyzona]|nr:hypothetical protein C8Q77DRAFT_1096212 [Trametes polyzona]
MSITMAEAFDAPMAEPGDIDVSMYPGGMATTDSWLSAEASMGDAAFSADAATFHYVQEGVEIEMLDEDEEAITEYEMADDGQAYYGHELEDVEVLDVSRAPSLPPADHVDAAADAPVQATGLIQVPSHDAVSSSPQPHHHIQPIADGHQVYSETHQAPPQDAYSVDVGVSADASGVAPEGASPVEPAAAGSLPAASALNADSPTSLEVSAPSAPHLLEENAIGEAYHGSDESAYPHTSEPQHMVGEMAGHSDASSAPAASSGVEADVGAPHACEDSTNGAVIDGGDPHEISEGVYIDPPPPVLLLLPPSAEYSECCLFNQPQFKTPSNAIGDSAPSSPVESLHLLLHDRPTLYYEPLSSVFEALRHEECIQNLPGCAEAEMVLDAYELQLTICEDNVYAHEVTLHELDVIHDGSDLHGPLRLKLKLNAPRFVTRYHRLREQIARLNVNADEEEPHGDSTSEPAPEHEPVVDSGDADTDRPDGDVEEHAAIHVSGEERPPGAAEDEASEGVRVSGPPGTDITQKEGNVDGDGQHGALEVVDLEHESSSSGVVAQSSMVEHKPAALFDNKDAGGAGEAADDDDEADGGEDGQEGEHGPDANDVHDDPDAGDGGDYVEHDEFPDDEDEFGDDLPEELGGQTENAAYIHTGTVEAPAGESEYLEDGGDEGKEDTLAASSDAAARVAAIVTSPVQEGAQDDQDAEHETHDNGLTPDERTDKSPHLASVEDHEEYHLDDGIVGAADQHNDDSPHQPAADGEDPQNLQDDNPAQEESTTLSTDGEGDLEDWDDGETGAVESAPQAEHPDTLSRKSSTTTLASRTSKRTYDEVELDDFDDDPSLLEVASSPDTKRPRVQ